MLMNIELERERPVKKKYFGVGLLIRGVKIVFPEAYNDNGIEYISHDYDTLKDK